ncbi:uncharacterized protein OCT59_021786 [Rhizophagus irregularis]|uniref:Uncharacterized protein n=2 Tax=Rhizophagus irregularis TaxID=588596 RepID=A0A015LVM2_RHIIW|nr:hypothetical protein RirG_030360 [Rhizophagus irregularis DAOM 197198w]UZO28252.1 hypothetical protein OCT59_021786 [Rhizophagus irregularis]
MRLYFGFLLLIILLTILPVKSSIIYEEPQPETPSTPRVLNTDFYDDGTIVVQIIRVNDTTPLKICLEENLSIRVIYPNGTIKGFDIPSDTLNIQSFNFCLYQNQSPLRFYAIKTNTLLFITYVVALDVNNPYTYEDWGMVIDLDGKIFSIINLGASFVNTTTNEWLPAQDSITLNVHRDNGFIRVAPITNTTSILLNQYKINENGEVQLIAETYMNYTTTPIENFANFATTDGYAIIYPNDTRICGIFLENGNPEVQVPFILYQIQSPLSKVIFLSCDVTRVGFGQTCILVLNTEPATVQNTFVKIDFLSKGSVYNITTFQYTSNLNVKDFGMKSLRYGGYFLFSTELNINDKTKLNLYGYIMDDYGNLYNWTIPYPTTTNFNGDVLVLSNNTLVIPQPEFEQTWSLITTDLYKIEGARDHGYGNLHIFSTTPKINDIINPSEIKFLIIKFYDKVDLSPNRNVTILQDDGSEHGIIRQVTSASGDFVRFIDDYTIGISVIDSTFNQPNTMYYILIDDGFVKSKVLQEPIIGIQITAWNFMTISNSGSIKDVYEKKVYSSSIDGKVRLTEMGTSYFKSFKHDKIKVREFFDNLTQELAKAIPVGPERITNNGEYKIDTSVLPERYILYINIKKAKKKTDMPVNLVDDLDTLIKYKIITVIGSGKYSIYLDDKYGYVTYITIQRWIDENLGSLLGTIALNALLLLISYLRKMFAIYTCGNAIEKFVAVIFFIIVDAPIVENIFIISIFFVIFPFIVNLRFAYKIIIDELKRNDFQILLKEFKELKDDLLKEGNDSIVEKESEKDNNTNEIINKINHIKNVNKLTKEAVIVRKELTRIKGELKEVCDLTKELEIVNELIETLENSDKREVKIIVEKLKKINNLIEELIQVEDSTEELKIIKHLDELNKIIDELKKVNDNEIELEEDNEEIGREFAKELNKIKELIEELKESEKLKEQLFKVEVLMKGLEEKELINELENLNNFKKELQIININELKEEIKELNNHAEFTAGHIKEIVIKNDDSIKEEDIKDEEKVQLEKKYRNFSKWLRDYKDNKTIIIIFMILAGVDVTHLELLGSKLRIRIKNLSTRNIDINFNAKLSYAAKDDLFWGDVTNVFIEDIPTIFLQGFYISRVISFGFTPVYIISTSIIHLFTNMYYIYKYKN